MKNLGKAVFSVVAAAAFSACFSDPTSDLRNGPERLSLSNRTLVQRVGDVDQIDIQVHDAQGNSLPFGDPTFTSLDPAIATLEPLPDSTLRRVPGNTLYKSVLSAISPGETRIVVTVGGITDTVHVFVLPLTIGSATVGNSVFGANTELTITAPPNTAFNTTGAVTTVSLGATTATATSRTATTMTVISPVAFTGPIVIRNLRTSTQAVDTVVGGVITIAPATFTGAITVGTSAVFGPTSVVTVTAPAGTEFSATSPLPTITVGAVNAPVVTVAPTQLTAIIGTTTTGAVTVGNLTSNGLPLHALPATVAPITLTKAVWAGPGIAAGDSPTFGTGTLLTITAPAGTAFRTTPVPTVLIGATAANVITNTPTTVTAIVGANLTGTVTVGNLTGTGGVVLPTLVATGPFTLARATFTGGAIVGAGALGPGTLLTLTPPAGTTFATGAPLPTVSFGATPGTVLTSSATQLTVISSVAFNGTPTVTGLMVGTFRAPVLIGATTVNLAAAAFPGTVSTPANLLSTITVTSGANATFAANSQVVIGGRNAIVITRSATTMTVKASVPANAPVSVTNVIVGTSTISSLTTAAAVNVPATTGEPSEPNNNSMASTQTLTLNTTFDTIFGALQTGTDANDFYRVTLAAPGVIEAFFDFITGPDYDVYVTRDVDGDGNMDTEDFCNEFGGTFAEADCTGATGAASEHEVTKVLPAGTYFINVELFTSGGVATPTVYRLIYRRQ